MPAMDAGQMSGDDALVVPAGSGCVTLGGQTYCPIQIPTQPPGPCWFIDGVMHCAGQPVTCPAGSIGFPPYCTPILLLCPTGQTWCGSSGCANTQTDNSNCGTCGTKCSHGQTCKNGTCTCPDGQTSLNTNNDCGTCRTKCSHGQNCKNGTCTCPDGQTSLDTNNDCGTCETKCSHGQICNNGTCTCSDGQTSLSTLANCGTCGNSCTYVGSSCVNGSCGCESGYNQCGTSSVCCSPENASCNCCPGSQAICPTGGWCYFGCDRSNPGQCLTQLGSSGGGDVQC